MAGLVVKTLALVYFFCLAYPQHGIAWNGLSSPPPPFVPSEDNQGCPGGIHSPRILLNLVLSARSAGTNWIQHRSIILSTNNPLICVAGGSTVPFCGDSSSTTVLKCCDVVAHSAPTDFHAAVEYYSPCADLTCQVITQLARSGKNQLVFFVFSLSIILAYMHLHADSAQFANN